MGGPAAHPVVRQFAIEPSSGHPGARPHGLIQRSLLHGVGKLRRIGVVDEPVKQRPPLAGHGLAKKEIQVDVVHQYGHGFGVPMVKGGSQNGVEGDRTSTPPPVEVKSERPAHSAGVSRFHPGLRETSEVDGRWCFGYTLTP